MSLSVSIFGCPELNACSCQVSVGQNTGLNERLVDEWVIDIGKLGCRALPLSKSNHTRSYYANSQCLLYFLVLDISLSGGVKPKKIDTR